MILDEKDRLILNRCQRDFPLAPRPFAVLGERLGMAEGEVLARIRRLHAQGVIRRLGPVLSPRQLAGDSLLAAMHVPPDRLEEVIALVNHRPEVTHNYEREHYYNLWFVVSAEDTSKVADALGAIERESGIVVLRLPMLEEYFIGTFFEVED